MCAHPTCRDLGAFELARLAISVQEICPVYHSIFKRRNRPKYSVVSQQRLRYADLNLGDGAVGDLAFSELDREVQEAQLALINVAEKSPKKWWPPEELRARAQNGWGGDVMMFALTDLVNRGRLKLDGRLYVRYRG